MADQVAGKQIFISYRRKDAGGYAANLCSDLQRKFGAPRIFFDDLSIERGPNFGDTIDSALAAVSVILVVIGPDWADSLVKRQKKSDVDWVRREVETAIDRMKSATAPAVFVVCVGDGVVPSLDACPRDLRAKLPTLLNLSAFDIKKKADLEADEAYLELATKIALALPVPALGIDLARVLKASCEVISQQFTALAALPDLVSLHDGWQANVGRGTGLDELNALAALRSAIKLGIGERRLGTALDGQRVPKVRDACVRIVGELLRCGACRIAHDHQVLGEAHRLPADLETMATHLMCWTAAKGKAARLHFERGTAKDFRRVDVERVIDQKVVVTAGILDQQREDILMQLQRQVPELDAKVPVFNAGAKSAQDVRALASALRTLNRDPDQSRVTIALTGRSLGEAGADLLRGWLADLKLDVDVVVRSGVARDAYADVEGDLIVSAWQCLVQIERIGADPSSS
jgi:hypothetical protein